MKTLFTSDTHFGHANIIKYCNRPFSSVTEMDEVMIDRWNSKVDKGDVVYHLGDIAMRRSIALHVLPRLNGRIILIAGNHDQQILNTYRKVLYEVHDVKMIRTKDGNGKIFLSHYSHRSWPEMQRGVYHLYGHDHAALPPFQKSFDVGVDAHDFYPLTEDEVIDKMREL